MRPIDRGGAPQVYAKYEDAKPDLVARLGSYCSYCERTIATLLAVEHVLPKGLPKYKHLERDWNNFLLGCVNCNSAKKDRDSDRAQHLWPDEHNTFRAFTYDEHLVKVSPGIPAAVATRAAATITICKLNRRAPSSWNNADEKQAVLERFGQRKAAFRKAQESLIRYQKIPEPEMAEQIAETAVAAGFFSIWMKVFAGYPAVLRELVARFPNTHPGCFDANAIVQPHPTGAI